MITDYVANGSFASLKANVRTYKEKNYALFVRTVDFASDFKGDLSYIDKESYEFLEKSKLYGGELMLSNIGASIGKVFKVPCFDIPMSLAPNAIILRFFSDTTCDFFEYVFKSFVGQDYLQLLSGGAAMPKFNKTDLRAMIAPIPPMNEQAKIVAAVKSTLAFIDDLDASYSGLSSTIQSLKSKILDLAIRGQLVPQDPTDEPASVLLERIRAEKEELIRQGKIKRDKKESIIFRGEDNSYYEKIGKVTACIDSELPFELPADWCWCRLGSICTSIQYGLSNSAEPRGTHRLLRITDIQNGKVDWDSVPFTSVQDAGYYSLQNEDIVFARTGATVGKSYLISDIPYDTVYASYLIRIRLFNGIDARYIYDFFNSDCYWTQITSRAVGVGQPNCNGTSLGNLLVPIPPTGMQNRIITSASSMMKCLIAIEKSLN